MGDGRVPFRLRGGGRGGGGGGGCCAPGFPATTKHRRGMRLALLLPLRRVTVPSSAAVAAQLATSEATSGAGLAGGCMGGDPGHGYT